MVGRIEIFGDPISGNCLKVRYAADYLGRDYEWIDVDIMAGESRTPEFLAINRFGQVPCVRFETGETLAQSNAIIFHLAEGSELVPTDPVARARGLEWMFWEQYSHEPYVAVCRFQRLYLKTPLEDLDPIKVEKGRSALVVMDNWLADHGFIVGDTLTVADIALFPYTYMAEDGGFDLSAYPNLNLWLKRVEDSLDL